MIRLWGRRSNNYEALQGQFRSKWPRYGNKITSFNVFSRDLDIGWGCCCCWGHDSCRSSCSSSDSGSSWQNWGGFWTPARSIWRAEGRNDAMEENITVGTDCVNESNESGKLRSVSYSCSYCHHNYVSASCRHLSFLFDHIWLGLNMSPRHQLSITCNCGRNVFSYQFLPARQANLFGSLTYVFQN